MTDGRLPRRDVFRAGLLAGSGGAAAAGCATTATPSLASRARPLRGVDIPRYVARMDSALSFIGQADFFADVSRAARGVGSVGEGFERREALGRKLLRAMLASTMYTDLDERDREHPLMVSRLGSLADEFDATVLSLAEHFDSTLRAERIALQRSLRTDTNIVARMVRALDEKSSYAGVPSRRREHLADVLVQGGERIRQGDPGVVMDEYSRMVRRVERMLARRGARQAPGTLNPTTADGGDSSSQTTLPPISISSPSQPDPGSTERFFTAPSAPQSSSRGRTFLTAGLIVLGVSVFWSTGAAAIGNIAAGPSGAGFGLLAGPVTFATAGIVVGLIQIAMGATRS